ncbi:YtzC family protein [Bacillus sp. CGMCC 1.16607]|uniref:YtzC family protein n=1 Tax=Bacillus sp. CGMCC 1.16607 TaxID=3351842 RepID=UPI003637D680
MATRQSVDDLLQRCEDAIRTAQDQYLEGSMQEHYNDDDYTNALQGLEEAFNDLATMANSANSQQREQLHRMRLQLQQAQNNMILLRH